MEGKVRFRHSLKQRLIYQSPPPPSPLWNARRLDQALAKSSIYHTVIGACAESGLSSAKAIRLSADLIHHKTNCGLEQRGLQQLPLLLLLRVTVASVSGVGAGGGRPGPEEPGLHQQTGVIYPSQSHLHWEMGLSSLILPHQPWWLAYYVLDRWRVGQISPHTSLLPWGDTHALTNTHTHLQSYLERTFTSIYLCHSLFKTFNLDLTFKFEPLLWILMIKSWSNKETKQFGPIWIKQTETHTHKQSVWDWYQGNIKIRFTIENMKFILVYLHFEFGCSLDLITKVFFMALNAFTVTHLPIHFLIGAKAAAGYLKSIETVTLYYITSMCSCSQIHSAPAVATCLWLQRDTLSVRLLGF